MNDAKTPKIRARAGILRRPTSPPAADRKEPRPPGPAPSTTTTRVAKKKPAVDEALVADAARHIREVIEQKAARGLDEVGAFVLAKFYGDDPVTYESKSHAKSASLSRLERLCGTRDLPISRTVLGNAVHVVVVRRRLPPDATFAKLPQSFRIELLPLNSPEKIERFASKIVADPTLTVRKLRKKVREQMGKSPGGRQARGIVQAVAHVISTLGDAETAAPLFDRKHVDALSGDAQSALRTKVEQATKLILGLEKLLPAAKRPDVGTHGKALAA